MMNHPFLSACWIAPTEKVTACEIEKKFTIAHVSENATLTITGLGYFQASVNGRTLGEEYFQPVVSDYHARPFREITYPCKDTFTHRIYYRKFSVKELLRVGENVLSISLGGGFYVQNERTAEGEMGYGDRPICIFTITADEECIVSDGSEKWCVGPLRWSNLFIGEYYDATIVKVYAPVSIVPAPEANLSEQIGTPDRVIRTVKPVWLKEVNGRQIYDVGENISGVVRILTKAGYTGEVILRFAENLQEDGALDFGSTGGDYRCLSGRQQIMQDRFVCDGTARSLAPQFVWHAFRYFDVAGEIAEVEALVIHADIPVLASFESDCEGMNFLFEAYMRSQLTNMHGSIPSDCPHRERLGYTGDGQVCAPSAMLLMDSREFYRKWIRDILDCQDIKNGHVQHTAPFQGGGGGPCGWGGAIVFVPYYYWKQWGDLGVLQECYEPMCRWINYIIGHSENGLVVREEEGGWCLGDWCTLEACRLPEPFVNTFFFIKALRCMQEIAEALQDIEYLSWWRELEETYVKALQESYYNKEKGVFFDGTQGADAYAAALGLQDPAICAAYYDKLGHFDTGFLGTDVLCEVLFENGYEDVAYKLLAGEDVGSFLWMKRHGATTLWEHWTGGFPGGSHNHPMFGACTRQLFSGLLGIRQTKDSVGWQKVTIEPHLPAKMQWAKGTLRLPSGEISVFLQRDGENVRMQTEVKGKILIFS